MTNPLKASDEYLVLVDTKGRQIGIEEKLAAHQKGLLHAAFSLMIVRPSLSGFEYLLQRRAISKYHSGGLWANTCCSHPRPGESLPDSVQRRVKEELGMCEELNLVALEPIIYRAQLDNELIEHEFDHVFIAFEAQPTLNLNPDEVSEVKWILEDKLFAQLTTHEDQFSAWFAKVFYAVKNHLAQMAVLQCNDN